MVILLILNFSQSIYHNYFPKFARCPILLVILVILIQLFCLAIPLPFTSTQTSSAKVSSTVISFSSEKPRNSSVSSQWPTTSIVSTFRITSSFTRSTVMTQSRLRTSSLTALSTSLLPMISSHGLTSAFPSEKQTTVASTSQLPPTLAPSECRPGDCENGGTCVVPGYFCRCLKYYVWHRCSVYVGKCVSNDQERISPETERETPSLALGICEFHKSYF